jgi:hypothetical protein
MNLSIETITFGKYKNGTLDDILKDRQYSVWLLQQEWFLTHYEYLYNRVKEYNPLDYFLNEKTENNTSFLENYKYFNLTPVNDIKLPLTEQEKICYAFYIKTIEDLKKKIQSRIVTDNQYNIKAPVGWLQQFEKDSGLKREEFKKFIDSYDLPNITYIVEDIKKEGGIEYKGAQSFKIAKKRSEEQEIYWEHILKEKYGEHIGVQFKYEKCIFDFINISSNTIYECKLNITDYNEKQHTKYLHTLNKYNLVYLIGNDCIINMNRKEIYNSKPIHLITVQNKLTELIKDFTFIEIKDDILKYI